RLDLSDDRALHGLDLARLPRHRCRQLPQGDDESTVDDARDPGRRAGSGLLRRHGRPDGARVVARPVRSGPSRSPRARGRGDRERAVPALRRAVPGRRDLPVVHRGSRADVRTLRRDQLPGGAVTPTGPAVCLNLAVRWWKGRGLRAVLVVVITAFAAWLP